MTNWRISAFQLWILQFSVAAFQRGIHMQILCHLFERYTGAISELVDRYGMSVLHKTNKISPHNVVTKGFLFFISYFFITMLNITSAKCGIGSATLPEHLQFLGVCLSSYFSHKFVSYVYIFFYNFYGFSSVLIFLLVFWLFNTVIYSDKSWFMTQKM